MSLTPQAIKARVWGRFPTLRAILEAKAIPEEYYGASSASHNIFDELRNLLEIAIVVKENTSAISATKMEGGHNERLLADLRHLHEAYKFPMKFFQDAIEEIETIARKVRESC